MKYENNKYYTPEWLIKHMIEVIKETIKDEITEIIEPSAGDGRFLPYLKKLSPNVLMYDIEPDGEEVIQQDFLTLDIQYKKGRIIVGNPPFGYRGNLFKQFIIKATQIADYIVFILPSTIFNKNYFFKTRCSLIYSKILNDIEYDASGYKHKVNSCLNIYSTLMNDNERYNFSFMNGDILILSPIGSGSSISKFIESKSYLNYDFFINGWGCNQGKLTYNFFEYTNKLCIKIKNEKLRKDFNNFFETFYERYNDEIKKISPNGKDSIVNKTFIQEKLKKDFYKKQNK